jgi:hypothetical protein
LHFGESLKPSALAPKYHLPSPLIRQLHLDIKPYLVRNQESALNLAEELWHDDYAEIKQLAIFILGNTPVDQPGQMIKYLESWLDPELDEDLKSDLLSIGTQTLQNGFPAVWEKFIKGLLNRKEPKLVGLGIQGIKEGLENARFGNYPALFRLISPSILDPDTENMEALENLLKILITQSPTEAAYYLRQTLSISQSPETTRLIKKCLPIFPEDLRQDLKSSLAK